MLYSLQDQTIKQNIRLQVLRWLRGSVCHKWPQKCKYDTVYSTFTVMMHLPIQLCFCGHFYLNIIFHN
jgi:hypothetical protein